jgi:MFS family permease
MVLDPSEARRATTADDTERGAQIRMAAIASVVGTSIEWYDYFLFGTAAAVVFPDVFFPSSTHYAGTLSSFATYAVGFAARPVGAAIFGHWGDRLGRKATLIVTLLLMGLASAAIGILPGTDSIGIAAPIILVVLRILQGIAVGGEWSGSVLLSMEWGNKKRRGLMASWPQIGVPIGLLIGTVAMSLLAKTSGDAFKAWGWRIPFLFSLVLVAIGLWVRLRVMESPLFAEVVEQKKVAKVPVVDVIKRHPMEIVLSSFVRCSEQLPFYILTTFALTYIVEDAGQSKTFALNAIAVAAALELILIPFFGNLSDSAGRKRVYAFGSVLLAAVAFPYFALLNTKVGVVVFLTVVIAAIPHAIQYGPQSSLIAETFPTKLRYGGAGIGYQLSSVFAGGPAPLLATWLLHDFGWWAISILMVLSSVLTLIAIALLPKRDQVDIADEAAYA